MHARHALLKGQLTFLTKNQDQNSLKLDSITPYKISLKSKKCELKQKFYNIAIKYIQKWTVKHTGLLKKIDDPCVTAWYNLLCSF